MNNLEKINPNPLSSVVDVDTFDTKTIVRSLESMMNNVTKKECTPETVNAACNAADKITEILKVHVDVTRLKLRYRNK